jgi:hypothetical protein
MLKLIDTLCDEVKNHPALMERITAIDEHDFTPIVNKVRYDLRQQGRNPSEKWLQHGILALKQYYAIAVIDGLNMHAVSDIVDIFWHAHILHTKDYFAFCDKVVGGYMHHDPLNHDDEHEVSRVDHLYRFTMRSYSRVFNYVDEEFTPKRLQEQRLMCVHFIADYSEFATQNAMLPASQEAQPWMAVG